MEWMVLEFGGVLTRGREKDETNNKPNEQLKAQSFDKRNLHCEE
jgi:hypothetical protein